MREPAEVRPIIRGLTCMKSIMLIPIKYYNRMESLINHISGPVQGMHQGVKFVLSDKETVT